MKMQGKRLGDVVTLKRGHDLPEASRKEGAVPIVSSSGITGYHNVPMAQPPGVVTGRYGTLGEVFYIEEPYWPLNTALYAIDFHGNNPRFIAYFLKQVLRSTRSDKAAVPGVNRNDLHEIPVRIPDTDIQERIADIAAAYDNLIEVNRRRIKLLEHATQLLYEEWFVRFRFPGHENLQIIDGMPEGWEKPGFVEVIEVNPTTAIEKNGPVKYVPMAAISTDGMSVDSELLEERSKSTSVHFKNGDTLLARITPCLENGKTGYVDFLEDGEVACGSTEFIVLRGKRLSSFNAYCLARSERLRGIAIKSMIGSSGRQRVQTSCFGEFLVPIPPQRLLKDFDDFASETFHQIKVLTRMNVRLIKARNLILPKMLSGELAV
jgi:type I restriction enzyme S subunit